MREIRDDIKEIFRRLAPPTLECQSPLRLTDYGRKLSKKLEAEDWAQNVAPDLMDDVSDMKAFQVHEFSMAWSC